MIINMIILIIIILHLNMKRPFLIEWISDGNFKEIWFSGYDVDSQLFLDLNCFCNFR